MGENENENFENLFNADEIAELQGVADEVAAEVTAAAPKKDGLWYVKDEGVNSLYAFNMGGKTVLWFTVDNAAEMTTEQIGGSLPFGVSAHRIVVWNAYRSANVETNGFAARYLHLDGTGVHIDGKSIRSYMMPRVSHWIGEFYGV